MGAAHGRRPHPALFALAAVILSLTCVHPCLEGAIRSASRLARSAEVAETLLTAVCRSMELGAVDDATDDDEAAARVSAIQARCTVAWSYYDQFRADWLVLASAIEAVEGQGDQGARDVESALERLAEDEERLLTAIRAITESSSSSYLRER